MARKRQARANAQPDDDASRIGSWHSPEWTALVDTMQQLDTAGAGFDELDAAARAYWATLDVVARREAMLWMVVTSKLIEAATHKRLPELENASDEVFLKLAETDTALTLLRVQHDEVLRRLEKWRHDRQSPYISRFLGAVRRELVGRGGRPKKPKKEPIPPDFWRELDERFLRQIATDDHLAIFRKLRGFAIPGRAREYGRRAHELKRRGEAPDVYEWAPAEAKAASKKAAIKRQQAARTGQQRTLAK